MEPRAAGELFHYQVLNINTSFLWLSNNMLKTLTVFNVHPVEAYRKKRAREKVKKLSLTVAQDQSGNWGKGREEYAFAKGCHWFFKLLLRLHTAAGFYVQGLKSTTVVAYRFCAYLSLSFRTVIPGGGYSLEFLVGVYRLVFQSWPYHWVRLENVTFHTRFQIGPLRNYVTLVT